MNINKNSDIMYFDELVSILHSGVKKIFYYLQDQSLT